ncbi:MAG: hypothetical protein WCA89_18535 [Terracidiphilus sp.]
MSRKAQGDTDGGAETRRRSREARRSSSTPPDPRSRRQTLDGAPRKNYLLKIR